MTSIDNGSSFSKDDVHLALLTLGLLAERCSATAKSGSRSVRILQRKLLGDLAAELINHSSKLKEYQTGSEVLRILECMENFLTPTSSNNSTHASRETGRFHYLRAITTPENNFELDAFLLSKDDDQLRRMIEALSFTTEVPRTESLWRSQGPAPTVLPSRWHSRDFETSLCFSLDSHTSCSCGRVVAEDEDHLRRLAIRCPEEGRLQGDPRLVSFRVMMGLSSMTQPLLSRHEGTAESLHASNFHVTNMPGLSAHMNELGEHILPASGLLCKNLHGGRRRYSDFLIYNDGSVPRLWDRSSPSTPGDDWPLRVYSHSLKDLMQAEQWSASAGRDIRLAYIFALAIWQYYDTEWMPSPWTKEQIEIVSELGSNDCYPYIRPSLWGIGVAGHGTPEERYIPGLGCFYPKIMALGVLMVELSKGPTYGGPDQSNMTDQRIRDNLNYFNRLPSYSYSWNSDYVDVIRNCFDSSLFHGTVDAESRQHIIEREIVLPLERLYRYGVRNEPVVRHVAETKTNTPTTNQPPPLPEVSMTSIEIALTPEEDWIKTQFKDVQSIFTSPNKPQQIRIAVFDTGCSPEAPHFRTQKLHRRNVVWRDFVESNNTHEWKDEDATAHSLGHGTSIVSLLLNLVPRAKIYVGRIARTRQDLGTAAAKQRIVQAIKWAVEPEQNVDIINLSFGFDDEVKGIFDAIAEAIRTKNRNLLIFAAANNRGNEPEKFPASVHEHVISVRGAYMSGAPVPDYNPRPTRNTRPQMFCTLARDVPCDLEGNTMSGCSVATPILAATAALFLQYASCIMAWDHMVEDLEPWRIKALHEKDVMEALFRKLGREMQGDTWYVQPRDLFDDLGRGFRSFRHTILGVVSDLRARDLDS